MHHVYCRKTYDIEPYDAQVNHSPHIMFISQHNDENVLLYRVRFVVHRNLKIMPELAEKGKTILHTFCPVTGGF